MKRCTVLLCCCVAAACDGAGAQPRFFARTDWQSPRVCPPIPQLAELSAVTDVSLISDSTFAILLGDERRLLVVDAQFRVTGSLQFDKDGPRGVLHPVSALVTDTMIFVADDARSLLRLFRPTGEAAGTLRLPFIPRRLRLTRTGLVVTPLVAGTSPAELAFQVRAGRVIPLGGQIARYDDIGVNTLANMTSVAPFDDRIVVMHEMVVPFGYVIRFANDAVSAQRFGVPLDTEVRSQLGDVPREPLTDRNVNQLAVVAFAATADRARNAVYYVTRTGGGDSRRFQKLVVRLDSLLGVAEVIPINVNPQHILFLPARRALVAVDSDGNWFECRMS